ncbi:MAG: PAS-domain containing protein [Nitrosospira sp.]
MTTEPDRKSNRFKPFRSKEKGQGEDALAERYIIGRADIGHAKYTLIREQKMLAEIMAEGNKATPMLQAVIESIADGLLVTDENGKIFCYNQLYLEMWPIPPEVILIGTHQAILQYCSDYIKDPKQFLHAAAEIYAKWPRESFDVLLFNSGRIFERYSKIKFVEGQSVGRVWSFRDITGGGQAEARTARSKASSEGVYKC